MFVEGTLRWQVTEDCPWDLLMALALRDLAGLTAVERPPIPRVFPPVARVMHPASGSHPLPRPTVQGHTSNTDRAALAEQWRAWWELSLQRERRPIVTQLKPPHFEVFDRAIELQDLVTEHYEEAFDWSAERHAEYARLSLLQHSRRAADIVDVVRDREHELRRQAGYFRLDIYVLPLAEPGAWIVAPHTVVASTSLRDDSAAFREWFTPVVAALV
ncbi:hypothetical protein G3T36_12220 [Diaminobutyricibacter tongyongensis]|uniref:Uncharacterized protein n=1 Tax=Leifsonia tongyongensis TaxID=1268043 RepID=A0A6L9XYX4_9MICO|nr:hypothetical protein [Diaminobutyricibacter tongyongensis]NEN06632.1 hypothetical protein [Diaminobutyricibacter tongyongensis]